MFYSKKAPAGLYRFGFGGQNTRCGLHLSLFARVGGGSAVGGKSPQIDPRGAAGVRVKMAGKCAKMVEMGKSLFQIRRSLFQIDEDNVPRRANVGVQPARKSRAKAA